MKALQAGLHLVRDSVSKKRLKPRVSDEQKSLLSFPAKSSLEVLRQRTRDGLKRLESQAEYINELSAELEVAVLEFKAISSEVNRDWRAIQRKQKSAAKITDICEYRAAVVPQVERKKDSSFVLKSRLVDLFQAEREAALLAQTLRSRAKKKQGHRRGRFE
jgi:hypothetical protein